MDTIGAFLASRAAADARTTLSARDRVLRLADRGVPGGLFAASPELLGGWLGRPGLSRGSRATYAMHLRGYYRWLVRGGLRVDDPTLLVAQPSHPRRTPRPLGEQDWTMLLRLLDGGSRDRLWVMLAGLAGLRACEIAGLRVADHDPDADLLRVLGKGGGTEQIPLRGDVSDALAAWCRSGSSRWVFPSDRLPGDHVRAATVAVRLRRVMRGYGIAATGHQLRHTYGTRLLRSGCDLRQVQELMRHRSIASTQAYTAVTRADLRAAVARL